MNIPDSLIARIVEKVTGKLLKTVNPDLLRFETVSKCTFLHGFG